MIIAKYPFRKPSARMRQRVTVLALCVCVSVCLSVCLCYHSSGCSYHSNTQTKVRTALIHFMTRVFVKMLRSEVMASFAYCESHYRNPELIPSMTQGYKVVQKPNGALNAGIQANATQRAIILSLLAFSVYGPVYFSRYTFQLLKRGGVHCKTSYACARIHCHV